MTNSQFRMLCQVRATLTDRRPNQCLVSACHPKKPAYDELNLPQWVAGQLSNALLIEDSTLLRHVLTQVVLAMRDGVSLPWLSVRSAWAFSMTEIEEGQLGWADSKQWSLNRISKSQLVVMNSQNVSTSGQRIRICRFFNEGTCTSEDTTAHTCNFVHTATSRDIF